jgi:hypothetical protein
VVIIEIITSRYLGPAGTTTVPLGAVLLAYLSSGVAKRSLWTRWTSIQESFQRDVAPEAAAVGGLEEPGEAEAQFRRSSRCTGELLAARSGPETGGTGVAVADHGMLLVVF